ncbi:Carboxyl-terminal-processing peptidase 1, chloroplastic [Coccomyxa sp. Obi]|nr:Carboxyl-terminal-processing peptidase 1, chloroplastic [Coccomyxa sp. Obi]
MKRSCAGLSASLFFGYANTCYGADEGVSLSSAPLSYDAIASRRHGKGRPSNLPSSEETAALLELEKQDLFTQDAWEGMLKISDYVKYVEGLEAVEDKERECVDNRLLLEKAWQVVANEFYDCKGRFSQAAWAGQLLQTLQDAGGCLHTRSQTYTALKAMMASLDDRYTAFLLPSQFRQALRRPQPIERDYLEAQFTGVGVQLGEHSRGQGWTVDGCLAESPAEEAGILQGDLITEIDGYPTESLKRAEMVSLLRGPSSSGLILTVSRQGLSHTRAVYMERRPLPQPPIKEATILLDSNKRPTQYVRMHYVSSSATRQMASLLRRGQKDDVAGFILDLRNNPGGVFEEAVAEAAFFLEPGQPIAQTVRNQEVIDNVWVAGDLSSEVFPQQPAQLTTKPVVILVNSGTASAAEVLTGALHDNHRATVVGQKTFGKGVVQFYFPMDDAGSGLKVTVSKYLGPTGYDISRNGGITPDIMCNDYPHGGLLTASDDRCIAAALRLIQAAS